MSTRHRCHRARAASRRARCTFGSTAGCRIGCTIARTASVCAALAILAASQAAAQTAAPVHERSIAISTLASLERVRLPGAERMGLAGMSLLFDAGSGWWLGPAVYGAAGGSRGGLFVGGAELQRRWRLGSAQIVAGLYAGGGGGAAAPVGGGLMLRPVIGWLQDLGPLQAGLALSAVRFPGGDISSTQLALQLAWDGRFRHAAAERAGTPGSDALRSGVGVDRLAGTLTSYALRGAGVRERHVALVGGRLEQVRSGAPLDGAWHWGLETAGAAQGEAGGYMEILGVAGWDAPIGAAGALRAGARVALGLGGGGGLPTGGGVIGRVMLGASLQLSPGVATGGEAGWLRAADTALRAPAVQWWLAFALEPPLSADGLRRGTLARTEWTAALQHYTGAARRSGQTRPLDTVGLKFTRAFAEHLYGTVQAHSAYAGGAGAYSVGLIGLGATTAARPQPWRLGAELLIGAAGGGGVASGGGAIVQGLAWAGVALTPDVELRLGAGRVRARREGLATPLVELSISRAFAQLAP